jgi:integrase
MFHREASDRRVNPTAVDDDLIRRNPCRLPRAGLEAAAERPTLSVAQVGELAGQVPPRYSALILLTTYASLRWGEVIALQRRDLDLDACTVRVRHSYAELSTGEITLGPPKSRVGSRVVAFPRSLAQLLRAHLDEYAGPEDGGLVFPAAKGGPLRRPYFNKLVGWKAAVEAIGVPDLHFHDLRHTGNHLAAQVPGTTVRDLMQRMGHDNERAAMIYLHATQGADRRIADALRVELGDDSEGT